MFFSLSFSLPHPLSKNKIFLKNQVEVRMQLLKRKPATQQKEECLISEWPHLSVSITIHDQFSTIA